MFGDLTTLTLSYALGDDLVRRSDDDTFERPLDRQIYGVGVTQILTQEPDCRTECGNHHRGRLSSTIPYRSVRYFDSGTALGYSFEPELVPEYPDQQRGRSACTRYFLPYRAAIEGEYRFFVDTWDIEGHTASLDVHPSVARLDIHRQVPLARPDRCTFLSRYFLRPAGHQLSRPRQGAQSADQLHIQTAGGLRIPQRRRQRLLGLYQARQGHACRSIACRSTTTTFPISVSASRSVTNRCTSWMRTSSSCFSRFSTRPARQTRYTAAGIG